MIVSDAMRATAAFRARATKKEPSTARGCSSVWRIDNQPAIHLSMNAFFVDGETLDCLAISSHLSRFFSVAEFGLGAAGVAAEGADGLAGAVVAGAGTAGVAGRAAFVFGFAAASGFVLALAERQALTNALRLSPFSPFFSAAALQAFVFSCWSVAARTGMTSSAKPRTAMIVFMFPPRWIRWKVNCIENFAWEAYQLSSSVSDRYNRGLENFRRITGKADKGLTDTFDKTAPDLERYLMEFVFGDVYSRPALDVKQRQLAAIAALGTCQPQLVVHINGALNVGCTEAEIVEIILAIAIFAGLPAAINAMVIAKQVFADRAASKK
jgi:4-carboxymuconolactone decarboxylase